MGRQGVKSSVVGDQALMVFLLQYWPIERARMGVGVAHLPILEAMGSAAEGGKYSTTEEISAEVSSLHRLVGETARISTTWRAP